MSAPASETEPIAVVSMVRRGYAVKPRISYYPSGLFVDGRPQYTREIYVLCPFCGSENHYREWASTPLVQRRRCYWCDVEHRPSGAYRIELERSK